MSVMTKERREHWIFECEQRAKLDGEPLSDGCVRVPHAELRALLDRDARVEEVTTALEFYAKQGHINGAVLRDHLNKVLVPILRGSR